MLDLDEEKIETKEEVKAGKDKYASQNGVPVVSMSGPTPMKNRTNRRELALNFPDGKGRTCLHYACASGKVFFLFYYEVCSMD